MVLDNRPTIYAIGSSDSYKSLFSRINSEFKSNSKYIDSPNKLNILDSSSERAAYTLQITTKYYDLDLDLVVLSPEDCASKLETVNLEGILLFLNKESPNQNATEFLLKIFDENFEIFKSIIRDGSNFEEVIENFKSIEDVIQINLTEDPSENDDNEVFSDLDELINSIFVHSWSNIELKDEKSNVKTSVADEIELKNETKEAVAAGNEDAFNFEELLMNLGGYKAKAEDLEFEERKKFAEDVVLKFWKSIGGDEDEINDLNEL